MLSTLKEATKTLKLTQTRRKPKKSIADSLLGKYEGIIPPGTTSSQVVREARRTYSGKGKE